MSKIKKRKVFISFSYEPQNMKLLDEMKNILVKNEISVDYSENKDRKNETDESIWEHLENRVKQSSITIVILTRDLFEGHDYKLNYKKGNFLESGWIYNEISASLRNSKENLINGVIVVYEPSMKKNIWKSNFSECNHCYKSPTISLVLSSEIISENMFNINKKFKKDGNCILFDELDDSYISLVNLDDFKKNPSFYINNAFEKRKKQIANRNFFKIKYNFHK